MNNSLRKFTAGVTALMVMATMTSVAAFAEGETIPGASDTLPAGSSDTTLVPGVSEVPVTPAPADNALTALSESTPTEQSTGAFMIDSESYDTLQQAVNAANNGDLITMTGDVTSGGVGIFTKGGTENTKNIIIDFGGFTYTVGDPAVGSPGTESQGFHFEKGCTITMRNGTIEVASDASNVQFLIQNYCDLTLENLDVDITGGSNCYLAASNNNGSFTIMGDSNIYTDPGETAIDIMSWPSNGYTTGVTATINTTGKIEGKIAYGDDGETSPEGAAEKVKLNIQQGIIDGEIEFYGQISNDNQEEKNQASVNITGGQFTDDSWVNDNYTENATVAAELKSGDTTVGYYYGGTGGEIDTTKLGADSVEITKGANITVAGEDVTVTNKTGNAIQVNGSQVAAGASTVVNREPTPSSDRDSGGSGESELTRQRREEVNRLWKSTRNALRDAAAGDVITAEADEADNVPTYVLLPLYGRDVTLVVNHDGDSYTLTDDSIGTISANQVYFTFEAVAEFDAGEEAAE